MTFHVGDLVEIKLPPGYKYLGPSCCCGCGMSEGMQGVVVSEAYTSFEYRTVNHDVLFAALGRIPHGVWVLILRKIQPPPRDEVLITKETIDA